MGLKSAAFIAQRVTTAVKYICQICGVSIENYLDDLAAQIVRQRPGNRIKNYKTFWIFVV